MATKDDPAPASVNQDGVVSTVGQGVVSTSQPTFVTSSISGVQGSGSVSITNTTASGVPGPNMSVNQDAFSSLLQSGLISTPLADLQLKLTSLSVGGGVSVLAPGSSSNMDEVFGILSQMAGEHRVLMMSKKKRDIKFKLEDITNPLSKRAVKHDFRLFGCSSNIKKCFSNIKKCFTNIKRCFTRAIELVFFSVKKIKDRLKADHKLEDLDNKVGQIDMVTLRSQKKAFAAQAAMSGTFKWSIGKGRNTAKNRKTRDRKKKAKGGTVEEIVVKGGRVGKSPKNGCHRCKGPHYVFECPISPNIYLTMV